MSADKADSNDDDSRGSIEVERDRRTPSPIRALRDRNFWPFFCGNLTSSCGTWFYNIAQTLLVYRITGSLFAVSIVNVAQFASVIVLGPTAGVLADRFDRKTILLCTQLASAGISAAVAVLAATHVINLGLIIIAALMLGIASTFALPSMLSVVPQLVDGANLGPAVALNVVTLNVARAVGPVLGALVVGQFGVATAFGLNALSYIVLIVGLLAVTPRRHVGARSTVRPKLLATIRSLRERPQIAVLFVVGTGASMTIDPVSTLSPGYATRVFGRQDTLVGWFVGAFGLGAVFAGVWVSRQPVPSDRLLAKRMAVLVGAFVLLASTSVLWIAMIALVAGGFGYIGATAAALTRLQQATPTSEHGRLMALWGIAFTGTRPIAGLIDGAVASWSNVRLATLLMVTPAGFATWKIFRSSVRPQPAVAPV